MPAFQPYRGKPAVRNDGEGRGNVGIIRSPVRASTLPDSREKKISLSFQVASNRPPTIWRSERQHPVTETRAASVSAPLLDGNELRPVLHLHARHEPILAVLGIENRCFAFLHIEPVLAQRIDDVGLVRDEEGIFALFWHLPQHLAKCRGSPAIFVG